MGYYMLISFYFVCLSHSVRPLQHTSPFIVVHLFFLDFFHALLCASFLAIEHTDNSMVCMQWATSKHSYVWAQLWYFATHKSKCTCMFSAKIWDMGILYSSGERLNTTFHYNVWLLQTIALDVSHCNSFHFFGFSNLFKAFCPISFFFFFFFSYKTNAKFALHQFHGILAAVPFVLLFFIPLHCTITVQFCRVQGTLTKKKPYKRHTNQSALNFYVNLGFFIFLYIYVCVCDNDEKKLHISWKKRRR